MRSDVWLPEVGGSGEKKSEEDGQSIEIFSYKSCRYYIMYNVSRSDMADSLRPGGI